MVVKSSAKLFIYKHNLTRAENILWIYSPPRVLPVPRFLKGLHTYLSLCLSSRSRQLGFPENSEGLLEFWAGRGTLTDDWDREMRKKKKGPGIAIDQEPSRCGHVVFLTPLKNHLADKHEHLYRCFHIKQWYLLIYDVMCACPLTADVLLVGYINILYASHYIHIYLCLWHTLYIPQGSS